MNDSVRELEELLIQKLKTINNLNNTIERQENELSDRKKKFALNIIDIVDSFERIEESEFRKNCIKNEVNKATNRYKTIKKKLLRLLNKMGVTKIKFPENRVIVGYCEVVETETDNSRENDEIVSVIRDGYIRGKELIRPAEIIVVRN